MAAQPGETLEAARERLKSMPGGSTVAATLLSGPAGWREEWSSSGATEGRTVIVATADRVRTLIRISSGNGTAPQGIVTGAAGAPPADALLGSHLSDYLAGFRAAQGLT